MNITDYLDKFFTKNIKIDKYFQDIFQVLNIFPVIQIGIYNLRINYSISLEE